MNYYEELGVKKYATVDDIKHAYRKLAKRYHPDKNPGNEQAAKRFVRIATAYETLADEEKRKEYDESLSVKGKSQGSNKADKKSPINVDPLKMSEFENFFGFTMSGDKVTPTSKNPKSKTNPIDTSEMFEKFFGR